MKHNVLRVKYLLKEIEGCSKAPDVATITTEECKVLLDNIRASVGGEEGEVDLEKSLNCAALNIVWNLVAGQRFLYDDPQMKEIVRVAGERMVMINL